MVRKCIEAVLLVAGIAGVGLWGWSQWHESVSQREDSQTFDRAEESHVTPNNGLVGRLRIPRLHLSAMVRQGTGSQTLDVSVGHIPGTALPGEPGNVAVAAHRDTLFRGLRDIERGDLVQFETTHGSYFYRVNQTQIVSPQDVWVLKAAAYPELTMVTCYPFDYIGAAPNRFIVKARQVAQLKAEPLLVAQTRRPRVRPVNRNVTVPFEVAANHSRQLAPGISIGLTSADTADQRVDGWMWVMPDRRTIWLRGQGAGDPVVFYGREDGRRRELVITSVSSRAARGYLVIYPG